MDEEKQIVENFAQAMLDKIQLRHNRYAPLGWRTMDVKRLLTLLKGEIAEFEESYSSGKIEHSSSEAIDIANYAMFLFELTKQQ